MSGKLDLGREGGHSMKRIIHAKDLTGKEIERALLAQRITITKISGYLSIILQLTLSPSIT